MREITFSKEPLSFSWTRSHGSWSITEADTPLLLKDKIENLMSDGLTSPKGFLSLSMKVSRKKR
jgi:hypothetical protein